MLAIETNYGEFGPTRVSINPLMLSQTLFNTKHEFNKAPFAKSDIQMGDTAENLDDLMDEFEDDEKEMYENESEGDYEEIDEYDPEFSIFGSE